MGNAIKKAITAEGHEVSFGIAEVEDLGKKVMFLVADLIPEGKDVLLRGDSFDPKLKSKIHIVEGTAALVEEYIGREKSREELLAEIKLHKEHITRLEGLIKAIPAA